MFLSFAGAVGFSLFLYHSSAVCALRVLIVAICAFVCFVCILTAALSIFSFA